MKITTKYFEKAFKYECKNLAETIHAMIRMDMYFDKPVRNSKIKNIVEIINNIAGISREVNDDEIEGIIYYLQDRGNDLIDESEERLNYFLVEGAEPEDMKKHVFNHFQHKLKGYVNQKKSNNSYASLDEKIEVCSRFLRALNGKVSKKPWKFDWVIEKYSRMLR